MVSMMPLAQTLAGIGEIDSAIELLEQLVAGRRKANGLDSLATGIASNELGVLKMLHGDVNEALALFQVAADIAARVAPKSGEHTRALNQLGTLHELRGDLVAAEDHYRRSLAIRRVTFGADDVNTLRAEHNLCRVLIARGSAASAGDCAMAVYQRRRSVLGDANPETDDSRAMVEGQSAAPDRAWLVERFEHYRGLGPTHLTRKVYFATLLAASKAPSADDLPRLSSLAEALRKAHGANSVYAALTELQLAQLARRLGRTEIMASALERAERVLPNALTPESISLNALLELRAIAGSAARS
jgi:tetratricopeptide (TPR) repeat protein